MCTRADLHTINEAREWLRRRGAYALVRKLDDEINTSYEAQLRALSAVVESDDFAHSFLNASERDLRLERARARSEVHRLEDDAVLDLPLYEEVMEESLVEEGLQAYEDQCREAAMFD